MAFTFGQNWLAYSKTLDEQRVDDATASVAALLGVTSLEGRRLLDVGAGSGLFSIAALRLGAREVVAIDRDLDCLHAITTNAGRFLAPPQQARLRVQHADVLEAETLPVGPFDVVYAWGSLHHTGALWRAIDNVTRLCGPGGHLALAIYNRTAFMSQWHSLKRAYHAAPAFLRVGMVLALSLPRAVVRVARRRHPFRVERGMNVWYDSIDWLGGLPYEAATCQEVIRRIESLGFSTTLVRPTRRHGCNEFVFCRTLMPAPLRR